MKKVMNVGIGGRNFIIDEDAFEALNNYLMKFKERVRMGIDTKEVMNDLEDRIADIFAESIQPENVVSIKNVNDVISRLGMPDGEAYSDEKENKGACGNDDGSASGTGNQTGTTSEKPVRKLYRDLENKKIDGICSGLAAYFNIDVVIVRLIFLFLLFCGLTGFWIYLIMGIVVPAARTAAQKCEMHGLPVTFENLRKFANQ